MFRVKKSSVRKMRQSQGKRTHSGKIGHSSSSFKNIFKGKGARGLHALEAALFEPNKFITIQLFEMKHTVGHKLYENSVSTSLFNQYSLKDGDGEHLTDHYPWAIY